ncbi:hypothetical protein [Chlorobium sp.]|nr:hypothetical protein [Chlorobium sp.]
MAMITWWHPGLVSTQKVRGLARRIAGLALIGFGVRFAFAGR